METYPVTALHPKMAQCLELKRSECSSRTSAISEDAVHKFKGLL
jgi:hypothetical protein